MNETSKPNCSFVIPNHVFLASTVWLLLTSTLAVTGNVFVFFILRKSQTFHSNVRLLLKSFTVASCLLSAALASKSAYHFYIWQYGFFPVTPAQCGLFELLWDLGSCAAIASVACVGVERMISTIWKRKFTDFDRPSIGAYCLLGLSWTNGIATPLVLILLSALAQPSDRHLCYCHVVLSVPPYFMYFLVPAYTVLESATLISFWILYRHSRAEFTNFAIHTTQHSLAKRHQMLNNVNTIRLLMPTITIHAVCYMFVTAALTYLMSIADDQNPNSTLISYISLLTNLFSTEPVLQAVLVISGNKSYTKIALDYFPRLKRRLRGNRTHDDAVSAISMRGIRGKIWKDRMMYSEAAGGVNNRSYGVIDFRMGPDLNENILLDIWSAKKTLY